jgi:hypothetical protein
VVPTSSRVWIPAEFWADYSEVSKHREPRRQSSAHHLEVLKAWTEVSVIATLAGEEV